MFAHVRRFHVVHLLVLGFSLFGVACSGTNPISPSGGVQFDENKPFTDQNRPPSPPEGRMASLAKIESFGVYKGDCVGNMDACKDELAASPDAPRVANEQKTYVLESHQQVYTLKACVAHSQWQKRKLSFGLTAVASPAKTVFFVEEKDAPRPLCLAIAFNLMLPGGGQTNVAPGRVSMSEDYWDLFDLGGNGNEVIINLGFRAAGK